MKYLLDTHTIIWMGIYPEKLSKKVTYITKEVDAEFYISAVSFWEMSIKYALGKLRLKGGTPETIFEYAAKQSRIKAIDMTIRQAATFYKLPNYENKDPFDRMLAWQAVNENMILISEDKGFDSYKSEGLRRVW